MMEQTESKQLFEMGFSNSVRSSEHRPSPSFIGGMDSASFSIKAA